MQKTQKNYNERVTEERSGKKSYQLRKIQDEEASQDIEDYLLEQEHPERISPIGKKRYERN